MADSSIHEAEPDYDERTNPTRTDQAKLVASRLKTSAKRVFGRHDSDSASDPEDVTELFEDAAFNPQHIPDTSPSDPDSLRDKLYRGAHRAITTVKHPERALRAKYTRTIAQNLTGAPTAYDQGGDEELVRAYDELDLAKSHAQHHDDSGDDDNDAVTEPPPRSVVEGSNEADSQDIHPRSIERDVKEAETRVQQAQAQRNSLKAGWVLSRYVKRVRAAKKHIAKPPVRSDYLAVLPVTQQQRLQWDRYLGHNLLWYTRNFTSYHVDDLEEAPFDLKEFTLTFERLAAVSAPWQTFLAELREVYRWERPRRTFNFMVAYWVLWYFQQLGTAATLWIIYTTVRNKVYPSDIETIRERVRRVQDGQAKVQAWGELIQRHPRHDWVEPFLDQVGPSMQLGLSDMANFLETVQSFYEWKRSDKTTATLFFFFTCLLTTLLTDVRFCVKLGELVAGMTFFFALPISSRFPKYRKVVNPIHWVFWDIPNSAELAIMQLQEKSILRDAQRLEEQEFHDCLEEIPQIIHRRGVISSTDDGDGDARTLQQLRSSDGISFKTVNTQTHKQGKCGLARHGFWYEDGQVSFHRPYSDLLEIRKFEISQASDRDASRTAKLAKRIEEKTSLELLPSGIELDFDRTPSQESESGLETLSLMVSAPDRDKIFSLMIGWSNLKWQPHFSLNRRTEMSRDADHPTKRGKGNKDFDNVVGSFVK